MNLFKKLFKKSVSFVTPLTEDEKHEKLIRGLSHDIYIKCFYSRISHDETVVKYLYDKLLDIIKTEYEVPVYEVSSVVLNRRETDPTQFAAGIYRYRRDMSQLEQKQYSNRAMFAWSDEIAENPNKILDLISPHIEISNENNYERRLFVLAHELGHHMIELEGGKQSEPLADSNIVNVFQKHFHPAFQGVFHIALECYDPTFKIEDYKEHYLTHYLNLTELELPKYAERS